MKTLIIHPQDSSTSFLSNVYSDIDCDIITDNNVSSKELKNKIKNNDRIIMLGHGTSCGLLSQNTKRYIINPKLVYLLREKKQLIGIWCYANEFFKNYKLNGLCTGMIISQTDEAEYYDIKYNKNDISVSNKLFVKHLTKLINDYNIQTFINNYKVINNPIINFNKQNIFLYDRKL